MSPALREAAIIAAMTKAIKRLANPEHTFLRKAAYREAGLAYLATAERDAEAYHAFQLLSGEQASATPPRNICKDWARHRRNVVGCLRHRGLWRALLHRLPAAGLRRRKSSARAATTSFSISGRTSSPAAYAARCSPSRLLSATASSAPIT